MISARKGEFETGYERGGQTREHVQLAKTLGVSKLLVVVNKMDDPTVNWSKERCFSWFNLSVRVLCVDMNNCVPFILFDCTFCKWPKEYFLRVCMHVCGPFSSFFMLFSPSQV